MVQRNIINAVFLAFDLCFSLQAQAALTCTDAKWSKVLTDLKWTIEHQEAKDCVFDEMLKHGKHAFEAFGDCNSALRDQGLFKGIQNDYEDCGANACSWFIANHYIPACKDTGE